jgi:alpha-tubulin suppressor-like RCC1 family protein
VNTHGQLGDGTYVDHSTPVTIPEIDGVRDIAAADQSTCALLTDKTVWCWGDDSHGQLGDGIAAERAPVAPLLPCP